MADVRDTDHLLTALRDAGMRDTQAGRKAVSNLAGNGVTDDDLAPLIPLLLQAIQASPDPDRALNTFARWFAAVSNPRSHLQTLISHPVALEMFCVIAGASQYFGGLLIRHPEYFEIIANPGVRGGEKSAKQLLSEVSALVGACQRPELKRDALRRWKAREMLRIGVRDLAGLSDMPSTALEFSNLADACIEQALAIALATVPKLQAIGELEAVGSRQSAVGEEAAPIGSTSRLPIADCRLPPPLPTAYCPLPTPLSIIAMGKLGGRELNYSSDIDLMFVSADDLPAELVLESGRKVETSAWLNRLAETTIKALSEETADGHVFRVDMRLRPEGRFGPLVRSLSSCRAYYENWAEGWERQALIKARHAAGDAALGEDFVTMITPFVYRPIVSAEFIDEVRANKRKIERKCALEGAAETNVKTGYGGIRDIEFTVQLLQLELGGRRPALRTPTTMIAIDRLRAAGVLTTREASDLADDYKFLRTLEHRLQLLHDFQTQTMPPADNVAERAFLARRLGYHDPDAFETDLAVRRDRVHDYLNRLFYGEGAENRSQDAVRLADWSFVTDLLQALPAPAASAALTARLKAAGFDETDAAMRTLQTAMSGNEFGGMPPDTPREFLRIAPRLLALCEASAQPDAALAGIEQMATVVPNRAQLYASMADSPDFTARLVRLAAGSPPLLRRLCDHLEWLDNLVEAEQAYQRPEGARSAPFLPGGLATRLQSASNFDLKLKSIAGYHLRCTLEIGARDIWGWDGALVTMEYLTGLAGEVLSALLTVCTDQTVDSATDREFAKAALGSVAVIGLGKLGGSELGFTSDWDVIFAYDEGVKSADRRAEERTALVHRLVESVQGAVRTVAAHGARIEMDLRLRPWGSKGAVILTPRAYLQYFKESAEMWERQAALKARFVAGNERVGRRMEQILRCVSSARGATEDELATVGDMKRRIEAERLRPEDRHTDLKLGHGGLSDIEWLVQRLQLQYGPTVPAVRASHTLRALAALTRAGKISKDETVILARTYRMLTRLRNGSWLFTGAGSNTLASPQLRRVLARRFEYGDSPERTAEEAMWTDVRRGMDAVREVFERRFFADGTP